jgi:SET domain-containing protein
MDNKQIIAIIGATVALVILFLMFKKSFTCANNQYPVMVAKSNIAGRGVFATRDIIQGEIVEICPCLTTNDRDIKGTVRNYHFATNKPEEACLAFGYCSIVNHSDNPNCIWRYDDKLDSLVIVSLRQIKKGEEITHSYGQGYWKGRPQINKVT